MVSGWILEVNLRPFLTALGWFVGYDFDEDDWTAIHWGIKDTDVEADRWYDYEFAGDELAAIWLPCDPGSSIVHVRLGVAEGVAP
jgi:hypothetical protein